MHHGSASCGHDVLSSLGARVPRGESWGLIGERVLCLLAGHRWHLPKLVPLFACFVPMLDGNDPTTTPQKADFEVCFSNLIQDEVAPDNSADFDPFCPPTDNESEFENSVGTVSENDTTDNDQDSDGSRGGEDTDTDAVDSGGEEGDSNWSCIQLTSGVTGVTSELSSNNKEGEQEQGREEVVGGTIPACALPIPSHASSIACSHPKREASEGLDVLLQAVKECGKGAEGNGTQGAGGKRATGA